MSKTEILEELRKLTKMERQEIRLRLAELDSDGWLDDEDPLTVHEKALLEARIAAYAKDPDAGSTWEEIESRIRITNETQRDLTKKSPETTVSSHQSRKRLVRSTCLFSIPP